MTEEVPPFLARAACEWFAAEHPGAWNEGRFQLSDIFAVAVPRVQAVWAGEVRWSEASPGDRMVWIGRAHPEIASDRRYANFYDTFEYPHPFRGPLRCYRIFGNSNIGARALCNLQVPGQMGSDTWFYIRRLYAVPSRELRSDENAVVSLGLGWREVYSGTLMDAVMGVALRITVAPRQNFESIVGLHGVEHPDDPISIRVHLEGIETNKQQFGW